MRKPALIEVAIMITLNLYADLLSALEINILISLGNMQHDSM